MAGAAGSVPTVPARSKKKVACRHKNRASRSKRTLYTYAALWRERGRLKLVIASWRAQRAGRVTAGQGSGWAVAPSIGQDPADALQRTRRRGMNTPKRAQHRRLYPVEHGCRLPPRGIFSKHQPTGQSRLPTSCQQEDRAPCGYRAIRTSWTPQPNFPYSRLFHQKHRLIDKIMETDYAACERIIPFLEKIFLSLPGRGHFCHFLKRRRVFRACGPLGEAGGEVLCKKIMATSYVKI